MTDTNRPFLLIAEDHPLLRAVLREFLSGAFPACAILEAATFDEAVAVVSASKPLIILTDINMPGMDAVTAIRRMKADSPTSRIAVHSLHATDSYRTRCIEAGASAYISKADSTDILQEALTRLMAEAGIQA